jgi:hypothetical protein
MTHKRTLKTYHCHPKHGLVMIDQSEAVNVRRHGDKISDKIKDEHMIEIPNCQNRGTTLLCVLIKHPTSLA